MAEAPRAEIVLLGDAVLDMGRGTLSRDGRILPLRSKSFHLLCLLARNAGRVMSKEELLDAVWPDVTVTEDSLSQAIRDIRRHLGDDAQRLLRTVARRGFILCPDNAAPAAAPALLREARELPRIAVLPLLDRTGEPDRGPVLDGLMEEVTNGLARFRNLTVVARHSAYAAARDGLDLAQIGERLRADHIVDGSARLVGGQLRLSLSLNDASTGEVLWGDSFDCAGTGWLTLQDVIPRRIVSRLFHSIEEAGLRGSLRRGSSDLTAFEHLARGKALFRGYEPGVNEGALEHFAAAVEADPAFGLAHSYHAFVELALHDYGLAPREVKLKAKAEAALGVELSPDESSCHRILSAFHGWLAEWDACERVAVRAVELNPCDADALFGMALALMFRGRHAESVEWIERAKEINPLWPDYYDGDVSASLYHLGRYEESARLLSRLPRLSARQEMRLAATYARMGERDLARRHAERARAIAPGLDFIAAVRNGYNREHQRDHQDLIAGIELALRLLSEP